MIKQKITTKIGYKITSTEFKPDRVAEGVVIISPATGVKQTYYAKFSEFLRSEGYIVVTFDFGGISESKFKSLKAFDTSASAWGNNDLEAVLKFYQAKYPKESTSIIGHSIGGQLIGLAASIEHIDKVILVAAQSGYWKFWKGFEKSKMYVIWNILFPILTRFFGFFPGKRLGIMEDLPKSMALEWRKWCVSPNYLFDHIHEASLNYSKLTCEIHSYSAIDDNYAPKEAVDWMTSKYINSTINRKHLIPKEIDSPKIGHFGFFKASMRSTIWKMILNDIRPSMKVVSKEK